MSYTAQRLESIERNYRVSMIVSGIVMVVLVTLALLSLPYLMAIATMGTSGIVEPGYL